MKIILATYSNIPEIVKMWKEYMDFHKEMDRIFTRTEDGHLTVGQYLRDQIDSDDSQVLVAEDEGHVVAYAISQVSSHPPEYLYKKHGHIDDMFVKSNYRRKGIGEEMLARISEWFESQNVRRIELRAVPENHIGYAFWKKHGFTDYVHVLYREK